MSLVSHKKWSIERQSLPRPRRTIEFDWVETPDIKRRVSIYIRGGSPPLKGLKPTTRSPFWPPVLSYIANHRTGGRSFAHTTTIETSILDPRLRNSREPGGVGDEDRTRVLDAFDHPSPAVVIWCQFFAIKWKTGGFGMGKKTEGRRARGRSAEYFADNEEETGRDTLSWKLFSWSGLHHRNLPITSISCH